jgi:hypothetical protein
MATDSGDDQRIITPQDQPALVRFERQAIDLLAPALDVVANVGWEFRLTMRLERPQDVGK